MNISASQQLDQPTKGLSLKWTGEDIKVITNCLMVRDTNGELRNLLLYLKGNKAEAARQLLVDTKMGQNKLGVLYKTWRFVGNETMDARVLITCKSLSLIEATQILASIRLSYLMSSSHVIITVITKLDACAFG